MKRYGSTVLAILFLAAVVSAAGQWVNRWVEVGSENVCVVVPPWASHREGPDGRVRPLMDRAGKFVHFGEYDVYKTKDKP